MPRRLTQEELEELLKALGITEPTAPTFEVPARPSATSVATQAPPREEIRAADEGFLGIPRKAGTFLTGISRLTPGEAYERERWLKENPPGKVAETVGYFPLAGELADYARYGAPAFKRRVKGLGEAALAFLAPGDPRYDPNVRTETVPKILAGLNPPMEDLEPGQARSGESMFGAALLAAPLRLPGSQRALPSAAKLAGRIAEKKGLLASLEKISASGGGKLGRKKLSVAEAEVLIRKTQAEIGETLRASAVSRSIKTGKEIPEIVGETFAPAPTYAEIPKPVFERAGLKGAREKQARLSMLRSLLEQGGGKIGKRTFKPETLEKMIPKAESSLRRSLKESWGGKEKKAFQVMAETAVSPEAKPWKTSFFRYDRPTTGRILGKLNNALNEWTYKSMEFGNPASVGRTGVNRLVTDYFGRRSVGRHKAYNLEQAGNKFFKGFADPPATKRIALEAADNPALLAKLKSSADTGDQALARYVDDLHLKLEEAWSDSYQNGLLRANEFIDSYVPHVVKFRDRAQEIDFKKEFGKRVQNRLFGPQIKGLGGKPGAFKQRKHPLAELRNILSEMEAEDPIRWEGLQVDDDVVRVSARYLESVDRATANKRLKDQLLLFSREDGNPMIHPGPEPPGPDYVPLAPRMKIPVPGKPFEMPSPQDVSLDWAKDWFSVQTPDGQLLVPGNVWVDRTAYQSLRQFFEAKDPDVFGLLKKALYLSKRIKLCHPMVHGWHQINNEMAGPQGLNILEPVHGILRGQRALNKMEEELPDALAREFGLAAKTIRTPKPEGGFNVRVRKPTYGDLVYDAEAHRLNLGEWDEVWRNVFDINKDWWASQNENAAKRAGRAIVDAHDKILWDSLVKPIAVDLYMKYYRLYRIAGFPVERAKYMAGFTGTQLSGFMPKESMGALNRNLGRFYYFARDWTQTNRRQMRGSIFGSYGSTPIFNAAERKTIQQQDALVLARSLYYLYGVGNVINYAVTNAQTGKGRYLWQNPEGNKLDTVMWISPDGTEYSKNLMDQVRDMVRFFPGAHLLPGQEGEPHFIKTEAYKASPIMRNFGTIFGNTWQKKPIGKTLEEVGEAWTPWGLERTFVDPFPVSALNLVFGSIKRSHPTRRGAPRELPKTSIAGAGSSLIDLMRGGTKEPEKSSVAPGGYYRRMAEDEKRRREGRSRQQ